jgi:hypothetical protein
VAVKVSSYAFLSSGVEKSALLSGRFTPKERAIIVRWNYDMRFEEKRGSLQKEKTCCWFSKSIKYVRIKWRQSVKYKKYILHITATCSGYLNVAIVRLYTD